MKPRSAVVPNDRERAAQALDDEVGITISVEIRGVEAGRRRFPFEDVDRGSEPPTAVIRQDEQPLVVSRQYGEIQVSVALEIDVLDHDDPARVQRDRRGRLVRRLERECGGRACEREQSGFRAHSTEHCADARITQVDSANDLRAVQFRTVETLPLRTRVARSSPEAASDAFIECCEMRKLVVTE